MAPLDPNISPAEREFLERLREVASSIGTRAVASAGLSRLVDEGHASAMKASESALSKMLSGNQPTRPAVIKGLHILAAPHASPVELNREIALTTRLFYGWLQARHPDRLLLYRTQEEVFHLRDRLADAEHEATRLAAELADAHRRHAVKVEQLNSLRKQALAALGLRQEEIRQLTEEVKGLSRRIEWLEEALREAWIAVGDQVAALASAVDLVVDLAGRLVDTDDADPAVPPAH